MAVFSPYCAGTRFFPSPETLGSSGPVFAPKSEETRVCYTGDSQYDPPKMWRLVFFSQQHFSKEKQFLIWSKKQHFDFKF